MIRSGDGDRVAAWHGAAREDRRRLLEADLVGGELYELRLSVENRPGTVAEIALALGRAGVNIEDMALYPAPDMRTGAVSLWVAGEAEAERAAEIVRGLGHTVSISTMTRFAPSGPLRGAASPAARQVDQPSRGLIGAMGDGTVEVEGYLDSADTRVDPRGVAAARGRRRGARPGGPAGARPARSRGIGLQGPGERAGRRRGRIDVGNAGTLLRLLPGWLAGQGARGSGRSTATSRSAAAPWTGLPSRCARWAPRSNAATAGCPRSTFPGGRCAGSPIACRWRARR